MKDDINVLPFNIHRKMSGYYIFTFGLQILKTLDLGLYAVFKSVTLAMRVEVIIIIIEDTVTKVNEKK